MRKLPRNRLRVEIDEDRQRLIIQHTLGESLRIDVSWRGKPRPWIIPSGLEVEIQPSYWRESMQLIQFVRCPNCKETGDWNKEGGGLIHTNVSINGCESARLELIQFVFPYAGER